jgi:hypothetical protein
MARASGERWQKLLNIMRCMHFCQRCRGTGLDMDAATFTYDHRGWISTATFPNCPNGCRAGGK